MSQCCLAGRYVRNLFARGRGQSGAHDCRGVCALGVARAQADAPQYVVRACSGEAAVAGLNKGKADLLVLGKFRKVAMEDDVFAFGLPELGVKVTHSTAEAFLFSGVI